MVVFLVTDQEDHKKGDCNMADGHQQIIEKIDLLIKLGPSGLRAYELEKSGLLRPPSDRYVSRICWRAKTRS